VTIPRRGGRNPKWDRLHEQEVRETKAAVERIVGRELVAMELAPLLEVLSRWAAHRYKVCRNNAWQDKKREAGGSAAPAATLLPAAPVVTVMATKTDEEKLPWE